MTTRENTVLADGKGRPVRYMRVSVTDRCNLRCRYCAPRAGFAALNHSDIISYEEIGRLAGILSRRGVTSVRITGGEPLVRKHLDSLITILSGIPGISDISLTTNGLLLAEMAPDLRRAGLSRVNVSLDTLRDDRFKWVTDPNGNGHGGGVQTVLKGLEKAREEGLDPVKINVVLMRGFNDDELEAFSELTREQDCEVRFIEFMPMGPDGFWGLGKVMSAAEAIARLETVHGSLERMGKGRGSGPAVRYRIPGHEGTVGFITPISEHFCVNCNRIRITADGHLRTCLFSDNETDLLTPLRSAASDEEILSLIGGALSRKPEGHGMAGGKVVRACARTMSHIGG
ncbi:MAG: GTP 3',8-cyclase MoaA [bacterium]|nr:GTP 3',8-cyclase MoaA [bacterium]